MASDIWDHPLCLNSRIPNAPFSLHMMSSDAFSFCDGLRPGREAGDIDWEPVSSRQNSVGQKAENQR